MGIVDSMRNPTEEEMESVNKYIESISIPTGVNVLDIMEKQTEPRKTADYCDICNHKGCENCVADSRDDYCVPSNFEQTERSE